MSFELRLSYQTEVVGDGPTLKSTVWHLEWGKSFTARCCFS